MGPLQSLVRIEPLDGQVVRVHGDRQQREARARIAVFNREAGEPRGCSALIPFYAATARYLHSSQQPGSCCPVARIIAGALSPEGG